MVKMNQSKAQLSDLERHLWEAVHIITGPINASDYTMDSCVVVLRMNKPREWENRVIFINGVKQVTRERAFSSLSRQNLEKLVKAYFKPESHEDISWMVDVAEIRENLHNLSIPLYVTMDHPKRARILPPPLKLGRSAGWH